MDYFDNRLARRVDSTGVQVEKHDLGHDSQAWTVEKGFGSPLKQFGPPKGIRLLLLASCQRATAVAAKFSSPSSFVDRRHETDGVVVPETASFRDLRLCMDPPCGGSASRISDETQRGCWYIFWNKRKFTSELSLTASTVVCT